MHNNCGEIFSGFCTKPFQISTCFEIDSEVHFFSNFSEIESEKGRVAKAGGQQEEMRVGDISVKIILIAFNVQSS